MALVLLFEERQSLYFISIVTPFVRLYRRSSRQETEMFGVSLAGSALGRGAVGWGRSGKRGWGCSELRAVRPVAAALGPDPQEAVPGLWHLQGRAHLLTSSEAEQ